MDNHHDDWIIYLFLYCNMWKLFEASSSPEKGLRVLYRVEIHFIACLLFGREGNAPRYRWIQTILGFTHGSAWGPWSRDILNCSIRHGKPIDGVQESAELGFWARQLSLDSSETTVSTNFVLAFNPTLQTRRMIFHYNKR